MGTDLVFLMPRRYYRRRTVVVRPKKKWASNIGQLSYTMTAPASSADPGKVLVQNAAQSSNPTPTILKAGNFKASVDVSLSYSSSPASLPNCTVYILFLPEGISINTANDLLAVVSSHPEYVMAWRKLDFDFVNSAGTFNTSSVTMSSRLKRNLNSGDRIYFGLYPAGSAATITIQGTVQFWTCSN